MTGKSPKQGDYAKRARQLSSMAPQAGEGRENRKSSYSSGRRNEPEAMKSPNYLESLPIRGEKPL